MKQIKVVIDRFEGELAVIKAAGKEYLVSKNLLVDFAEGDWLTITIEDNSEETEKAAKKAKKLIQEIQKGE